MERSRTEIILYISVISTDSVQLLLSQLPVISSTLAGVIPGIYLQWYMIFFFFTETRKIFRENKFHVLYVTCCSDLSHI